MKRIARATLMDCVGLFDRPIREERGFMITINSCSDHDADATCKKVVKYAAKLNRNFLLAIEPLQWRGNVPIVRPHVHLLVDVTKKEAGRIASYFECRGADVDVTFLYAPRGACWYVGMTDGSTHYFNRRKKLKPLPREVGISASECHEHAKASVLPIALLWPPSHCGLGLVMTRAP